MEGWLYLNIRVSFVLNILFMQGSPKFLVTSLVTGLVCLLSQGLFEGAEMAYEAVKQVYAKFSGSPMVMMLCRRAEMAYEAVKQVYAKFSGSPELWKISVAHIDILLRGKRPHTAMSLVEDLIVGL